MTDSVIQGPDQRKGETHANKSALREELDILVFGSDQPGAYAGLSRLGIHHAQGIHAGAEHGIAGPDPERLPPFGETALDAADFAGIVNSLEPFPDGGRVNQKGRSPGKQEAEQQDSPCGTMPEGDDQCGDRQPCAHGQHGPA